MKLESIIQYLDGYLDTAGFEDYPGAENGLQVMGVREVRRIGAAVDASEESIEALVEAGADLILVHHGLFWDPQRPVTGRRYRKLRRLIEAGVALYSSHLPLDAHPEVGNSALLARAIGLECGGRFGEHAGRAIGWWCEAGLASEDLVARIERAVEPGPVRLVAGGPERIERLGVVTGGAASMLGAAAEAGLDALLTGEASHHHYHDARELGVSLILAGHYRTETFGVRALSEHLADRFGLETTWVERPTGI